MGPYDLGATTFYACQYDQRFSYCLYVPRAALEQRPLELLALIHGSRRTPESYRDQLAEFAERNAVVVLCPLFPVGIPEPAETGGYKFIEMAGVRYDRVLLAMVAEVAARLPLRSERFLMHGFSGGGQFAHRFLYLHPQRLKGLSVGAPGLVTLLDRSRDWWLGVADIEQRFGIKLDIDTIRRVPIQLLVGEQDLDPSEITLTPASRYWQPGANAAGANRLQRIRTLQADWRTQGLRVQLDEVAGIGHHGFQLLPWVERFFEDLLRERQATDER